MQRRYLVYLFFFIIFLQPFILLEGQESSHVELLIKLPTRSRPQKLFKVLDSYYKNLSGEVSYRFLITCDTDDQSMNCPEVIEKLQSYPNLLYYFGNSRSKIEACNKDLDKCSDFDVVLLTSDDMIPEVYGYDKTIMDKMKTAFPNMDGLLHFNDGSERSKLDTLPILGKKYYEQFGYIYHPEYISFYCDCEMTDVARLLGKYQYIETVIIRHVHPSVTKEELDSLYEKNAKFAGHDYSLYRERAKQNFGTGILFSDEFKFSGLPIKNGKSDL